MKVVTVTNVEKYYGNGGNLTKALDDVSFEIQKQDFCVVMGASGSGKTTLLNVISTIDTLSAGDITIHDRCVSQLRERELADFRKRELGFIFQDFNLLDTLTLEENIALPLTLLKWPSAKIDARVQEMANILDIQDVLHQYPYQVSGGQRQRCACARAMVHEPSLLLADEPTGALDSHASYQLMEQFQKMNEELQATILMVTHDAFSASYANRVLFLKDGKIFNEIYRGTRSRKEFFQNILDCLLYTSRCV